MCCGINEHVLWQVANQDAQQQVDNLLRWLSDSEDLFSHLRPVSVDKQTLAEQQQAHRVISTDIDNHRAQVWRYRK